MTSYEGYEDWKGWTERFAPTPYEVKYFAGETRDVKIANADILEIGFGSGSFLAWALESGARVNGSETQEALCQSARDRGIPLLPAAIETVAKQYAEKFDTIVAFDVFEHFTMEEVTIRLAACEGMLRPDGHLVLRFPNAQSPFGLVPQHGDATHSSYLSGSVFEQLIQTSKFQVERYSHGFRVETGPLKKRVSRIVRHRIRSVISKTLNVIYAVDIPWDPVVVLVLRKASNP